MSTETMSNTQTNEETLSKEEISKKLIENNKQIIRLTRENLQLNKSLERINKKDIKDAKKNRKRSLNPDGTQKVHDPAGFNKATEVPIEFYQHPWNVEPDTKLPRTQLTKMVYDYIKKNGLQKPEDKRIIDITGDRGIDIRTLFHLTEDDTLEFKNFQKCMKRLYNREELPIETQEETQDDKMVSQVKESEQVNKAEPKAKKKKKTKKKKGKKAAVV